MSFVDAPRTASQVAAGAVLRASGLEPVAQPPETICCAAAPNQSPCAAAPRRSHAGHRTGRRCRHRQLKLTLPTTTAIPAVQFNTVYLTPCSLLASLSVGSASDKRCSLGLTTR